MTDRLVRRATGSGWQLRVDEVGSGPAAYLLVHGYGVTSWYMRPLAAELAPSGRVLMPTLPGWRGSQRPRRPLDVEELADVLADWIRSESLAPLVVVGNSFGCQVAAELAARHPDLVRGLVLTGPTVEPNARSFTRMVLRLAVDTSREPIRLAGILSVDYTAFGPKNWIGTGRIAIRHRIEDVLPRVGVPTLIVRGSRDALLSRAWADRCTALVPDASFAEIPGAAHAVNYNSPTQVAGLIRDFGASADR